MKQLLLILYVFLSSTTIFAQTELTIAKRNGSILQREVLENNIGLEGGYLKPIFFKSRKKDEWEKAGYLCNRLKPYLYANTAAKKEFQIYRNQAFASHGLIVPAFGSLIAYQVVSINNVVNKKSKTFIGNYFRPNSLACLAVYFGSFYGSIYLNKNAETHLFKAVQLKNGRLASSFSQDGVGVKYIFR
jgi:hypothetical protein